MLDGTFIYVFDPLWWSLGTVCFHKSRYLLALNVHTATFYRYPLTKSSFISISSSFKSGSISLSAILRVLNLFFKCSNNSFIKLLSTFAFASYISNLFKTFITDYYKTSHFSLRIIVSSSLCFKINTSSTSKLINVHIDLTKFINTKIHIPREMPYRINSQSNYIDLRSLVLSRVL